MLVVGRNPRDLVQVHAVLGLQDAARPKPGRDRVAAVDPDLAALQVLWLPDSGLLVVEDRPVVEVAGHEHRDGGERLVVGAGADIGRERHLADVVFQPPAHSPHGRHDLVDRNVVECRPARGHSAVLEGLGQSVVAKGDGQRLHRRAPHGWDKASGAAFRGNAPARHPNPRTSVGVLVVPTLVTQRSGVTNELAARGGAVFRPEDRLAPGRVYPERHHHRGRRVVLYRKLHNINVNKVLTAMATVEYRDVVYAALFVAAGYFTLTFYDLFALRTIGRRDLPYRIAALAGFTSYSVGHNVGASVFTGGAVRYRIYSAWGLDAVEVAKICFIAGTTFWLGNIAVLGLGFAWHPEAASAIDQLPELLNRVLGVTALAVLAGYVAWVWQTPRVIGRDNWQVQLPGGPLTLLQIVIGIIDLGCCSLAMYVLVPNEPRSRLRHRGGGVYHRDASGICQPFARRAWRVRRRDADRAGPVQRRRAAGWPADLPAALLSHPVRACAGDPGHSRTDAEHREAARCRRRMTTAQDDA